MFALQIQNYEHELQSLTQTYAMLEQALTAKDREISQLIAGGASVQQDSAGAEDGGTQGMRVADLLILVGQMDEQLQSCTSLLQSHNIQVPPSIEYINGSC